jgi:hypothetical protein
MTVEFKQKCIAARQLAKERGWTKLDGSINRQLYGELIRFKKLAPLEKKFTDPPVRVKNALRLLRNIRWASFWLERSKMSPKDILNEKVKDLICGRC